MAEAARARLRSDPMVPITDAGCGGAAIAEFEF
jgi:hypothetical protein